VEAAALVNSWWLGSWYKFAPSFVAMFWETVYGVFVSGRSDYNCNLWTMQPELIGSMYVFLINGVAPGRRLRAICYIALGCYYWGGYILLFSVGGLLHDFPPEPAKLVRLVWLKAFVFILGLFLSIAPQTWLDLLHLPAIDETYRHMLAASSAAHGSRPRPST
jgi:hypothetical protein